MERHSVSIMGWLYFVATCRVHLIELWLESQVQPLLQSKVINSDSISLHVTLKYIALLCSLCKELWPFEMIKYLISNKQMVFCCSSEVKAPQPPMWKYLYARSFCKLNWAVEKTGPDHAPAHSQIIRSLQTAMARVKDGTDWLSTKLTDYSHSMKANGERTWAAAVYQAVSERSGRLSVATLNMDRLCRW